MGKKLESVNHRLLLLVSPQITELERTCEISSFRYLIRSHTVISGSPHSQLSCAAVFSTVLRRIPGSSPFLPRPHQGPRTEHAGALKHVFPPPSPSHAKHNRLPAHSDGGTPELPTLLYQTQLSSCPAKPHASQPTFGGSVAGSLSTKPLF